MTAELRSQLLHVYLLKAELQRIDEALESSSSLSRYKLKSGLGFGGQLYIARTKQTPPKWLQFVQTGTAEAVRELTNRTNAAVLIIKRQRRLFAFPFGHGRHLIKVSALTPDFGL